jgi:hypothetical protein
MNYCKNCKYRNEVHTMHGVIFESPDCGKEVTVTAPETFYKRQEQKQISIGFKEKLNADGNCQHYKPMFWFWRWWSNL